MKGRILAVDPGEKRIGIAVSDESATIANPALVLAHRSRREDALAIIKKAEEIQATEIVVGQSVEDDGTLTPMGRHSARLAEELRILTQIPVTMWDEQDSTKTARKARIEMGVKRSKRSGHLDQLAAAVILQSYLDSGERKADV